MGPLSLFPFGRLCDTVPEFLRPIEFRLARTVHELKAASHLVYEEYLKRGYLTSHVSRMKLSVFHALPTTVTCVAVHRKAGVIATVSIIEDSPVGLPMDEIYKAELDALRRKNKRLAEASMLALDSRLFGRGVFTLFHPKKLLLTLRLFKTLSDYLRSSTQVDDLVACFNPKHEILYDFLQLKPLGELKTYSSANGNPAVARRINFVETQQKAMQHPAYRFFYGKPPSAKRFEDRLVLTPEDLQDLFVRLSNVFASASPTELAHIRSCYPSYPFQSIVKGALPAPLTDAPFPQR